MAATAEVRRLHPLTPLFDLVMMARQFALPLVLALLANRDRGQLFFVIPTLVGTFAGALKWWRFTYTFDGARFVVSEGLLTRKQRVVPLDRIQQVDVDARLRHRLFGVVVLRIETAGGAGDAEVSLAVVSNQEAARLRRLLLADTPVANATEAAPTLPSSAPPRVERTLVRLGTRRLVLDGITGSELAVMLTVLFWGGQLLDDLPAGLLEDRARDLTAPQGAGEFALAGLFVVMVWLGLAAAASVLKDGGYTLTRRGEDLHVARGLLDRRESSVPLHRVQAAAVHEGFLRRLLRMGTVRFRSTAGSIEVPLLTAHERSSLLAEVLPGAQPTALVRPPRAARRRAILRRVVPVAIATGATVAARPGLAAFALILPLVAAVAGELAYRGLGHAWDGGFVVARHGGLRRETFIVPSAKAQSTRLRTSPLQRRAGLATLLIDVAGGGTMPVIRDGEAARLAVVQREVLSTATQADEHEVRRRVSSGG